MIDLRCGECSKLPYSPPEEDCIDESIICNHTVKDFYRFLQELQKKNES